MKWLATLTTMLVKKGQRTRTVKMPVQLRREAPRTHDEEGEARAPAPQPQAPFTSYPVYLLVSCAIGEGREARGEVHPIPVESEAGFVIIGSWCLIQHKR